MFTTFTLGGDKNVLENQIPETGDSIYPAKTSISSAAARQSRCQ